MMAATNLQTVTLHLTVDGAGSAADWYVKALGADERSRIDLPNGRLIHVQLALGAITLMLADEFPTFDSFGPRALGGTYLATYLHFDQARPVWDRAISLGATVVREFDEVFWGDLEGQILDPFGHRWGIAQHLRDVSHDDMTSAAVAAFGGD